MKRKLSTVDVGLLIAIWVSAATLISFSTASFGMAADALLSIGFPVPAGIVLDWLWQTIVVALFSTVLTILIIRKKAKSDVGNITYPL